MRYLAWTIGMDHSSLSRLLRWALPVVLPRLNYIVPPLNPPLDFCATVGSIDCSSHFRQRVHPGSCLFYRGDKRGFFLTAELVTTHEGDIIQVSLGPGHMNDQGMLAVWTEDLLERKKWKLLADLGYRNDKLLVIPNEKKGIEWNNRHASTRSVVEQVFSLVKGWKVSSQKFRQSPEIQEMALLAVYQLVAGRWKEGVREINSWYS